MAERQALRARAQVSLAPLGTCWRVGMLAWRMDGREGRGGLVAGHSNVANPPATPPQPQLLPTPLLPPHPPLPPLHPHLQAGPASAMVQASARGAPVPGTCTHCLPGEEGNCQNTLHRSHPPSNPTSSAPSTATSCFIIQGNFTQPFLSPHPLPPPPTPPSQVPAVAGGPGVTARAGAPQAFCCSVALAAPCRGAWSSFGFLCQTNRD